MTAVGLAITMYQRAKASSKRIDHVLAIQSDTPSPLKPLNPALMKGKIEFKNLSFKFPQSEEYVLKNISLKIEPGTRVAFLGTIGSGKSALLSLLPRLYPIERGMLFIDDIDINDWSLEDLRRQVGFVGQDVFLFSESVLENISFGLQEWTQKKEIYFDLAKEVTNLASVHEDIARFMNAYETKLGERGVNLSGGQKQRLTIARALAKNPCILVLDDALSSVDVQTEEMILASLRKREKRNTEIIAAHRISTVQDADLIVVIDKGIIRQLGTHNELLTDRRGAYRRYYEQQQLKEDLENYVQTLHP